MEQIKRAALSRLSSHESKSWLEAYLHPPAAPAVGSRSTISGIPDMSSIPSAVLNFKHEVEVRFEGTLPEGETWSCLTVTVPSIDHHTLVGSWSGSRPENSEDISWKWYRNSTFDCGTGGINLSDAAHTFRPVARSCTGYLNSASLYNQGRVFACQTAYQDEVGTTFKGEGGGQAGRPTTAHVLNVFGPLSTSSIVGSSTKTYTGLAKDGLFMPLAYSEPFCNYQSAKYRRQALGISILDTSGNTLSMWLIPQDDGTVVVRTESPLDEEQDIVPFSSPIYDEMMCGVTLWSGLLKQETVFLKDVSVYEVSASINSPWAPFMSPSAAPDSMAIEEAYRIRHYMSDAYPSSANDFESFWKGIPVLAPLLKGALHGLKVATQGTSLQPVVEVVEQTAKLFSEPSPKGRAKKATKAASRKQRARRK
jgi:hypothetical protein